MPFRDKLTEHGMLCPMRRKGNCRDNAPTESRFSRFKNERVFGERFETRDEMRAMAFAYLEAFYHHKRLRSTLGYRSPSRMLNDSRLEQQQEQQVA